MDKQVFNQRLGRVLKGTWAIPWLIYFTAMLALILISYDNPNKFLLEPRYDYDYGATGLDELSTALSMAIDEPHWPASDFLANGIFQSKMEIEYIPAKPVRYHGQPLTLMGFRPQQISLEQADALAVRRVENNYRKQYAFPAYTEEKIFGFTVIFQATTKLGQASAQLVDESRIRLYPTILEFVQNCTDRPDWRMEVESTNSTRRLFVDGCHKKVLLVLPEADFAELKAKDQLKNLQSQFASKFSRSFPGTNLCVLDWSYRVFTTILDWQAGQDLVASLQKTIAERNKKIINGGSYILLGFQHKHHNWLQLLFTLLFGWVLSAGLAVTQWKLAGWRQVFADLKRLVLSPWLWLKYFAAVFIRSFKLAKLSLREFLAQREHEKIQAKRQAQKDAEESERRRQRELQLMIDDRTRREAAEEAAKLARQEQETAAQKQLADYRVLNMDSILNHPAVDNGGAERLQAAWQGLQGIPVGESITDNTENLGRLMTFRRYLTEAQAKIDCHDKLVSALADKLKKINDLDIIIRSRFSAETLESLKQQAEKLKNPRLRPRDLRQVEYAIGKIRAQYTLQV